MAADAPNAIISLAASQTGRTVTYTARHDGPIEIYAIQAVVFNQATPPVVQTTHDIRVTFYHAGKRKNLNNRPIHIRTIQGDAGRPYILPETIWLPSMQAINITFDNLDVTAYNIEFILHGVKYYPAAAALDVRKEIFEYAERRERTYCYFQTTNEDIALAGNATDQEANYTIPDDTDFEIVKASAVSDGQFRVAHRDAQTDRNYTSAQIHHSMFFGGYDTAALITTGSGGAFPGRWATSCLVRRGVTNRFVIDEISGQTNNIYITLAGRKISFV